MGRLEGKVALVTGGTSGIGRATARLFRDEGALVVAAGVGDIDGANEEGIEAVHCDVSRVSDIAAMMAGIKERYGRLDVLFANAGISGPNHSVTSADEATYELIMGINLKGVFFTVQQALPLMADNTSIVLTSSIAAHQGLAHASLYAASKAGIRSLCRCFAAELAPRGIRVNTITPGAVATELMDRFPNADHIKAIMRERSPMKRLGEPIEIATVALFLASTDSSYMTGTETMVAGGRADL